jgi:hypothetical protein
VRKKFFQEIDGEIFRDRNIEGGCFEKDNSNDREKSTLDPFDNCSWLRLAKV